MCYIEKYRSSGEPFCSEAKFSDEKLLARQSRLHGKFSSRLAGLKFFHVIAKLIFSVFHRRAEILANRASPAERASPPHVIGPSNQRSLAGLHHHASHITATKVKKSCFPQFQKL